MIQKLALNMNLMKGSSFNQKKRLPDDVLKNQIQPKPQDPQSLQKLCGS